MLSRFARIRKGLGETLRKHPRGLYPLVNFGVCQVTLNLPVRLLGATWPTADRPGIGPGGADPPGA